MVELNSYIVVFFISHFYLWSTMFLLAHFIPFFNFKEDFVEFYVKVRGAPPSQAKLVLNLYGAGSFFYFWKIFEVTNCKFDKNMSDNTFASTVVNAIFECGIFYGALVCHNFPLGQWLIANAFGKIIFPTKIYSTHGNNK